MLFIKKVGTKITTVLTVASLMTQAHSVLQELDLAPSLEKMTSYLRNNRTALHNECTALEFDYTLWHEKTYDEKAWQEIMQDFISLSRACQESEKNKQDTHWLELLGEPMQSMLAKTTNHGVVSGEVMVSTNEEKVQLTMRMWPNTPGKNTTEYTIKNCSRNNKKCCCKQETEQCCPCENNCTDKSACSCASDACWQQPLDTFIDFMIASATKTEAEHLNTCGPAIKKSLTLAGTVSGIHGTIEERLCDKENHQFMLEWGHTKGQPETNTDKKE